MDRQPWLAKMKIELHVKSCVTTSQLNRFQLLIAYCKTTTIRNDDFILRFTCTGSLQTNFCIQACSTLMPQFFFSLKLYDKY